MTMTSQKAGAVLASASSTATAFASAPAATTASARIVSEIAGEMMQRARRSQGPAHDGGTPMAKSRAAAFNAANAGAKVGTVGTGAKARTKRGIIKCRKCSNPKKETGSKCTSAKCKDDFERKRKYAKATKVTCKTCGTNKKGTASKCPNDACATRAVEKDSSKKRRYTTPTTIKCRSCGHPKKGTASKCINANCTGIKTQKTEASAAGAAGAPAVDQIIGGGPGICGGSQAGTSRPNLMF